MEVGACPCMSYTLGLPYHGVYLTPSWLLLVYLPPYCKLLESWKCDLIIVCIMQYTLVEWTDKWNKQRMAG